MNTTGVPAGPGWEHMNNGGWMWAWALPMMLLWVAVIVVALWLAARTAAGTGSTGPADPGVRARAILAERYARGEIGTEEYQERLAELT